MEEDPRKGEKDVLGASMQLRGYISGREGRAERVEEIFV